MPDKSTVPNPDPGRRSVLRGLAVGGVALPVLAACSSGSASSGGSGGGGSARGPAGTSHHKSGSHSGGQPGVSLVSTSKVPVGGGTIIPAHQVVVTQPAKGDFKAFSSICTHMGCQVGQVTQGVIVCPCHGSVFSIKDGSVQGGPAPAPLPPVKIDVHGSEITRA